MTQPEVQNKITSAQSSIYSNTRLDTIPVLHICFLVKVFRLLVLISHLSSPTLVQKQRNVKLIFHLVQFQIGQVPLCYVTKRGIE